MRLACKCKRERWLDNFYSFVFLSLLVFCMFFFFLYFLVFLCLALLGERDGYKTGGAGRQMQEREGQVQKVERLNRAKKKVAAWKSL